MSDGFTQAIGSYLDALAQSDGMFAHVYKQNGKDIPDCCSFIIAEVKKTGRIGFSDAEIYQYAKHYFEEADIKPFKGEAPRCKVVTNVSSQEKFKDKAPSAVSAKNAQAVQKPAVEPDLDIPEEVLAGAEAPKKKEIVQLSLF